MFFRSRLRFRVGRDKRTSRRSRRAERICRLGLGSRERGAIGYVVGCLTSVFTKILTRRVVSVSRREARKAETGEGCVWSLLPVVLLCGEKERNFEATFGFGVFWWRNRERVSELLVCECLRISERQRQQGHKLKGGVNVLMKELTSSSFS